MLIVGVSGLVTGEKNVCRNKGVDQIRSTSFPDGDMMQKYWLLNQEMSPEIEIGLEGIDTNSRDS